MSTTITATTDAPGLTARMRLPRHHVAQRNQAIADALELVRRLETLTDHQVSDDPTPEAAAPTHQRVRTCQCEWSNAVNHAEIVAWLNTTDAAEMLEFIDWAVDFGCIHDDERADALLDHYGFEGSAEVGNRWPIFPGDLSHIAKTHHLVDSVHTFKVLDHIGWSIQTQTSLSKRLREDMAAHASMDRIEGTMSAITGELCGLGESIVGLAKFVNEMEVRAAEEERTEVDQ